MGRTGCRAESPTYSEPLGLGNDSRRSKATHSTGPQRLPPARQKRHTRVRDGYPRLPLTLPRADTGRAMSQESVEVVRRAIAYEYDGVGDRAEAEAIFDPQVVLNPIDEAASSGFAAMRA